jgi:MFS family permease
MDGMDSFIFALVMVPALMELLPRSGIPPTAGNIGFYGSILFALFLIGWGFALIWGPIADRFGRVRTLMLTVLCFSLFTFLSALATNVWMLAFFRLMAGIGIGGEWAMGATFVAEEWPEDRRKMGTAWMHTGYYFGFFLAAAANFTIGSHYGWRWMFALGGSPALLIFLIGKKVHEPARWQKAQEKPARQLSNTQTAGGPLAPVFWFFRSFAVLFTPVYRKRTILNSLFLLVSIIGLWAGSVYVPGAVTYLAAKAGKSATEAAQLASYSTAVLSIGTILGAFLVPPFAERYGRRITLGFYFVLMLIFIPLTFGYVFYLEGNPLPWFMVCLFFLGVGGSNFAVYSMWLPEQYATECRGSAFAFITNIGRFAGAGITFLVGAGVRYFGSLGYPVALTAVAFLIGLLLLPLGYETKGKPLPN